MRMAFHVKILRALESWGGSWYYRENFRKGENPANWGCSCTVFVPDQIRLLFGGAGIKGWKDEA